MLKSINFCLYLYCVDVAEVKALICYPCYLVCHLLILEQSAALSDANLPGEVKWFINAYLGLHSADSNSVKEFVEFLRD